MHNDAFLKILPSRKAFQACSVAPFVKLKQVETNFMIPMISISTKQILYQMQHCVSFQATQSLIVMSHKC